MAWIKTTFPIGAGGELEAAFNAQREIALIASWFNYINRVADALGVGRDEPGTLCELPLPPAAAWAPAAE